MVLVDAGESPVSLESLCLSDKISVDGFDPRVVALTESSCRILDKWGLWCSIESIGVADYSRMFVWDGEGTASIGFEAGDLGLDRLGVVVENSVLRSALYQRLQQLAVCHCLYGVGVEALEQAAADRVSVRLNDDSSLDAGLVIGADGANSVVKSLAGFESREWDYAQDAIVCTVKTRSSHESAAWQCFTRHGPLAFLPVSRVESGEKGGTSDQLKDQQDPSTQQSKDSYCSIVWSVDRVEAARLMGLSSPAFAQAMQSAFESRLGSIEAVSKRYSFPLWQRHTTQYVRGAVVLVGDAAHTIHPLAGQGINLGLTDAASLASALVKSAGKNKPLCNLPSLRRYERERLSENLIMMATVEFFKRLYSPGSSVLQLLRNRGMAAVDSTVVLKKQIIKAAVGL